MILEVYRDCSKSKRGRKALLLQCDQCKKEFSAGVNKHRLKSSHHFCSNSCSTKSPITTSKFLKTCKERFGKDAFRVLRKKADDTNLKRYGVKNPFQSKEIMTEEVLKKQACTRKVTNLKRYGVISTFQVDEFRKKAKQTCLERYGDVDYNNREKAAETSYTIYGTRVPAQSESVKEKNKETCLARYGVENVMFVSEIKKKVRETTLKRYGVKNIFNLPENKQKANSLLAQTKRKKTMLKNYGVEHPLQSKILKEKSKKTCLERYGVSSASKLPSIQDKRHQTMKENGSYNKSKAEDRFYDFLCERFGKKTVERQIRVNNWNIDFKINDIYVQFDGVYWHGLDRPLQEIKSSNNPRDKVILETFYRDQFQDQWFKKNNLKLIRITDKQFKHGKNLDIIAHRSIK